MRLDSKPVRTTIIAGLVFGVLYIPVSLFLQSWLYWPLSFKWTLLVELTIYSFFLVRWFKSRPVKIILPIGLLIVAIVFQRPFDTVQFVTFLLFVLAWIRSGICVKKTTVNVLMAELILNFGGAALAAFLSSGSGLGISMAIWLFSLFQALYFVVVPVGKAMRKENGGDRFEQAMRQAEKLMEESI